VRPTSLLSRLVQLGKNILDGVCSSATVHPVKDYRAIVHTAAQLLRTSPATRPSPLPAPLVGTTMSGMPIQWEARAPRPISGIQYEVEPEVQGHGRSRGPGVSAGHRQVERTEHVHLHEHGSGQAQMPQTQAPGDDGTLQSLLSLMAVSGMEWPATLMGSGAGDFYA